VTQTKSDVIIASADRKMTIMATSCVGKGLLSTFPFPNQRYQFRVMRQAPCSG
jgi:hypothetical protein